MKITLKHAFELQCDIKRYLSEKSFCPNVTINQFEDHVEQIDRHTKKVYQNINQRKILLDIYYELRNGVARANIRCGITGMISEIARKESDIALYTQLCAGEEALSNSVIRGMIEKMNDSNSAYYRDIVTNCFNEYERKEFKKKLKELEREKRDLSAKVAHLNMTRKIELQEANYQFLERLDML